MEFPAYKTVPTAELIPYARNSRTHSDAQVAQIAASIREFGFLNPIITDGGNGIVAGHGRVMAAQVLGLTMLPVIEAAHLTDAQRRAYVIADNKLALNAGWDPELLRVEFDELAAAGFDLEVTGFSLAEIHALQIEELPPAGPAEDAAPKAEEFAISQPGDVWQCGPHRVMCGDSTSVDATAKLLNGETAQLLHADPPYGMGKEADGVENDNLYGENLDRFQMEWWATFRMFLADNGSAYIWGNAPELWRLWYCGGLGDSEQLELRNEIVWDKGSVPGMKWDGGTQYQPATERCLFFQVGNQFRGNVNSEDFPETWEPVQGYMAAQAQAAGVKPADVRKVCGVQMFSHWFTKSQFTLAPEKHYAALAAAYPGQFVRPWAELKREWDRVKGGPTSEIQGARSYFDNAHDIMRDVWNFPRVTGEDRHGHATPKPVAMMERVVKSSCPPGGLVIEPFGGSGSTLIGAERTGRRCYTMELQARYVDVIVKRWQTLTGQAATLEGDGRTFEEIANE